MATYGNQDYTNFRAINLRGSTAIRFEADTANGTIKAELSEGISRAWTLPNKSGTFPIMGTFAVQLAAAAANISSTAVTVTGIRAEDAVVVMPNRGTSAGYSFVAAATYQTLIGAEPRNGSILLTFANSAVSTGYTEMVYSYIAVR